MQKAQNLKIKHEMDNRTICLQAMDFVFGDMELADKWLFIANEIKMYLNISNIFEYAQLHTISDLATATKISYQAALNYFNNEHSPDDYDSISEEYYLIYTARTIVFDIDNILEYFQDQDIYITDEELSDILNRANGNSERIKSICQNYVTQDELNTQTEEYIRNAVNKVEKFTTLGLSGSGKTCFMVGMYYKMLGGLNGYTLKASDEDDNYLTHMYENLRNGNLKNNRFPKSTNQSKIYTFDLQYGYKSIDKFEWIDYKGGILKDKGSENIEEYNQLKQDIASSKTLFIFVDGENFCDEDVADATNERERINASVDIIQDECARYINHFISEYTQENDILPPIAIVITKYDLVVQSIGKSGEESQEFFDTVIKKAFNALIPDTSVFNNGNRHESFVGIIPVSLGTRISENENSGKLRPKGIELPAFMGIWFLLNNLKNIDKNNADNYTTAMNMIAEELEASGVHFFLNGQKGRFAEVARVYCQKQERNIV